MSKVTKMLLSYRRNGQRALMLDGGPSVQVWTDLWRDTLCKSFQFSVECCIYFHFVSVVSFYCCEEFHFAFFGLKVGKIKTVICYFNRAFGCILTKYDISKGSDYIFCDF